MAENEIIITEEMVFDFNKSQIPSIIRYGTSDKLLGKEIEDIGDSPFQQLSEGEKAARIDNYIEKHKGKIFNRNENELRKKCEQEYNSQACGDKRYTIDESRKELLKGNCGSDLVKDAAALCQLTYACDPNRAGDNLYHTASRNWMPYIPEQSKEYLSARMNNLFQGINWIKPNLHSLSNNYSISQKIGFGMFKEIFFGENLDIIRNFDRRLSRKRTGFFSMLYYRTINGKLEFAYVTAGTTFNLRDQPWDAALDNVLVNLGQGLTGMSPQHTLAIQNAKILDEICRKKSWNLYFFGHSLGGGLAVANALATDREAIVFNNAGLNRMRNRLHNSYVKKNRITCYYTDKDFLSTENENKSNIILKSLWKTATPQIIGKREYLGTGGHGIDGICQEFGLEFFSTREQIKTGI